MAKFLSLASSSKGNCTYLSCGENAVLIDAGISYKAIVSGLSLYSLSVNSIKAVFITHEHTDHIKGLPMLIKKLGIPVYASVGTLEFLSSNGYIPPETTLIEIKSGLSVFDFFIDPFPTPHDGCDPLGFRFTLPDRRSIAIATDLGHVTDTVACNLRGCDVVMLESNYDPAMLDCSSYPYYLKHRIKGQNGHLANAACALEMVSLVKSGTTRLLLSHLSEQNNMPAIAFEHTRSSLEMAGMKEGTDYILQVAPHRTPSKLIVL